MAFIPSGVITLTTDFGTRDGYVGAMKGVLLREFPAARIVDISHDIAAQDVAAGAHCLAQAATYFPDGTVHVGVVDPGVGSARRALVIESFGSLYVGPDNGLLTRAAPVGDGKSVVWPIDRIPPGWAVHPTFHGRDLFARVAGRLAAGTSVSEFSSRPLSTPPVRLALEVPEHDEDGTLVGAVIHIDRFGNVVTNVKRAELRNLLVDSDGALADTLHRDIEVAGRLVVEIADQALPVVRTYADVEPGSPLAYIGSSGDLELAIREGSAAEWLGAKRGMRLRVRPR